MDPDRYLYCLETLRLSQRGLAPLLGCSDRLPRMWAVGRRSVPEKIAKWLEDCVRMREQYPDPPPPLDWRRTAHAISRRQPQPRFVWRLVKPPKKRKIAIAPAGDSR